MIVTRSLYVRLNFDGFRHLYSTASANNDLAKVSNAATQSKSRKRAEEFLVEQMLVAAAVLEKNKSHKALLKSYRKE